MSEIEIRTEDGTCDAYVASPAGDGPFPSAIFFMDGVGLRPALRKMADRVAALGYYVLLPNLYYRVGAYEPFDAGSVFSGGPEMARLMKIAETANDAAVARDTKAFFAHLEAEPRARAGKVACFGYCLGGGLAMRMACEFPERLSVAASFHGGRFLVTPEAPAMLAAKARAELYVGIAEKDPRHTPEVTEKLQDALTAANVPHTLEVYPGAAHGFAVEDLPVYDRVSSERHWARLGALLERAARR